MKKKAVKALSLVSSVLTARPFICVPPLLEAQLNCDWLSLYQRLSCICRSVTLAGGQRACWGISACPVDVHSNRSTSELRNPPPFITLPWPRFLLPRRHFQRFSQGPEPLNQTFQPVYAPVGRKHRAETHSLLCSRGCAAVPSHLRRGLRERERDSCSCPGCSERPDGGPRVERWPETHFMHSVKCGAISYPPLGGGHLGSK